jgi:hypothetical protein
MAAALAMERGASRGLWVALPCDEAADEPDDLRAERERGEREVGERWERDE